MAFTVKLTIDTVVTDITAHVVGDSIRREQVLHNDLKTASDQASFSLKKTAPKAVINGLMATTAYVGVEIQKDAADYFVGVLTDTYRARLMSYGFDTAKIDCEDFTDYKMNVPWVSANSVATQWLGCDICKPVDPATSLLHKIAALAGVTVSAGVPAVAITIDYFVIADKDKPTYSDTMNGLLYEHGYSFGFDASGELVLHNLNVSSTTTTKKFASTGDLTTDNILGQLEISKAKKSYKYFDIKWWSWKQFDNQVVFSDTTGGDDANKCNVAVPPDGYYPEGASATAHVYGDYKMADGSEILMVGSVASNIVKHPSLEIVNSDNLYKSCHLKIKNNDTVVPRNITTLELIGTGIIVKDAENHTTAGNLAGSKRMDYEAKYLHDKVRAQNFANLLANFYTLAAYGYQLKSKTSYQIGDIVQIQDSAYSGLNIYARIVKREDQENGSGVIAYSLYGVSAYSATIAVTLATNNTAGTNNSGRSIAFNTAPQRIIDLANAGDIPVNGLVPASGQLNSPNFVSGLAGWAIGGSGNAEFNAITLRGTIYAVLGKIAGWFITSTGLRSAETGKRIDLNPVDNRVEVWADAGTEPKTAMGYLGGLSDPANRTQQLDAGKFGFWASEGETIQINGDMQMENGAMTIKQDASIDVLDAEDDKAMRFGNDAGALGLHFYGAKSGAGNNPKLNSITRSGSDLAVSGGLKVNGYAAMTMRMIKGRINEMVSNWAARSMPADRPWRSVCWSPELMVFCAVDEIYRNSATSPDGINWTSGSLPSDASTWKYICWSPKLMVFCAIADNGAHSATSADGRNWTYHSMTYGGSFKAICWSQELSMFCVVGPNGGGPGDALCILTSPDGITWTRRTSPDGWYTAACWSPELGIFCAVSDGIFGSNVVVTSQDGINWSASGAPINGRSWASICWSPSLGQFCAVALNSNTASTSPDGINWTTRTLPATAQWTSICWSEELKLFMTVASSSNVAAISYDGITWNARTLPASASWNSVCFSPETGIFCAVSYGIKSATSLEYFPRERLSRITRYFNPGAARCELFAVSSWGITSAGRFTVSATRGSYVALANCQWVANHNGTPYATITKQSGNYSPINIYIDVDTGGNVMISADFGAAQGYYLDIDCFIGTLSTLQSGVDRVAAVATRYGPF